MIKKIISAVLAIIMAFTVVNVPVKATNDGHVYMSISFDGQFIEDKNSNPVAYVPVALEELAAIDLESYGLADYYYDGDGDGEYDITALHLYIYTHEEILGLNWDDVRVSGGAGSIFFEGGLFGFEDCNLNYYLNGAYPELSPGWGATADYLSLEVGDFYDVAAYTSWNFYGDPAAGFHYFADDNGNITHAYNVETGNETQIQLVKTGGGFGNELTLTEVGSYDVYYGTSLGDVTGTLTTDDSGYATIPALSSGTWYLWCDGGYGEYYPDEIVSAPAVAILTVEGESTPARQPQDVSAVLNATMAKLASTVTEPAFGTNAGEWTVLSLARGEYYNLDNVYFADYYNRIVEYVNEQAASVNLNGALHKSKSTDNSRVILALSSIGKDATSVGDWNLVTPYNDFDWVKKQGFNGVIYTLLALDSNNYKTTDTTIRQQCLDYILNKQLSDGGWALSGNTFNTDITAMTLQALYPYRNNAAVLEAAEEAIALLSDKQLSTGGFLYGTGETSESTSQVIVALSTWGINPDTDSRFIKDGNSAIDNLLSYYIEEDAMFAHQGNTSNAMATDQACYALVAYNRLIKGQNALYDYSDVQFAGNVEVVEGKPKAILTLPSEISDDPNKTFNAIISIDQWDNDAGYKLIDFIVNVPEGLTVENVSASNRLSGGVVQYNLESETGKLRVVYFDANEHGNLSVSGNAFPSQLFTITFNVEDVTEGDKLNISIDEMSIKLSSDSENENAMIDVDVLTSTGLINVIKGISYKAVCLYVGDNVDLIADNQKAIAVSVAGIENVSKLTYSDGTNEYEFMYNLEISEKSGILTYVALVDADIEMSAFEDKKNYTFALENANELIFGDANNDGIINAQDALNAVDAWLRKTQAPTDNEILSLNVNGDSRINTFDALGIVEKFVDGSEYGVVTKAISSNNN